MKATPDVVIDPTLRSPRYAQVYAVLRDWIAQGVYAPGERLPSESEFCELFKVSRITVRSAIEMLEKEGMVERIQGRGTFVADVVNVPHRGDLSELVRRVRQLDASSTLEDVSIREEAAEENVARDLQIAAGAKVLHASYVRLRNNQPIGVADIYIPASLGVKLTAKDVQGPAPVLLEAKGIALLGAHQFIGAALADSRMAAKLGIPVGAPLVQVSLQVVDMTSRPVELLLAHYRADLYTHHVFLAARTVQAPPKPR